MPNAQPPNQNPQHAAARSTTAPGFDRPFHILTPLGVYIVQPAQFAGPLSKLAEVLRADDEVRIEGAFELPGADGPVDITRSRDRIYLSIGLPTLRLFTFFRVNPATPDVGGGLFEPVFHTAPDALRMDLSWPIPPTMDLRLIVHAQRESDRYTFYSAYLAASHAARPGFFRLPLPNIYDDARVCMGNEFGSPVLPSLSAIAAAALTQFNAASWNTDLLSAVSADNAKLLFRFNPEGGNQPVPPPGGWDTWDSHCERVSHPALDKGFPAAAPTVS